MRNLSIGLFIILVFCSSVYAKLAIVPLVAAIKDVDLIIIGTLRDVSEKQIKGETIGEGKIVVGQLIAGNMKTEDGKPLKSGDKLQLDYAETFACVMGSHKRMENKKGVFLLTLNESGEIISKDFRSLERLDEIKKLLKKGALPSKEFRTIKLKTEIGDRPLLIESSVSSEPKIIFSVDSPERSPDNRIISVILVILTSISLYYLLYRSRFRIR